MKRKNPAQVATAPPKAIPTRRSAPPRHSTAGALLKHLGTWVGGDAKELLENLRSSPGTAAKSRSARKRRSTARSLLKFAGTWVGDDLEECLKKVYATRSKMEF